MNHKHVHDFNQTPSGAPMASGNNKAQQHDHTETMPGYRLKLAAELGLYMALSSMVVIYILTCVSLREYTEPLRNLLCPVLKPINQHVNMSKLVSLIELFSFLVIICAVTVLLLLGAKFTRIHVAMLFIWSILMLQGSDTLTIGIYLIILGLYCICWSRKKQQPNGNEKLQPKREPKSYFEMNL
ncbi:uncharacterized protein LOC130973915 [Arachis stenosperma]|uniref:uncharacterized protein LOC130973915 n=1 Tax=Arachis stenosperma TaxID=217475 RepID=UPI0025ACF09B|nr:uncharacterized protein LOC130973915 [Arachis stenosperma]